MNLNQSMMASGGDFPNRVAAILDLRRNLVQQLTNAHWNLLRSNPDVRLRGAPMPGPFPRVAEHLAMQVRDELRCQQVFVASCKRPPLSCDDVLLFPLIERRLRRDV